MLFCCFWRSSCSVRVIYRRCVNRLSNRNYCWCNRHGRLTPSLLGIFVYVIVIIIDGNDILRIYMVINCVHAVQRPSVGQIASYNFAKSAFVRGKWSNALSQPNLHTREAQVAQSLCHFLQPCRLALRLFTVHDRCQKVPEVLVKSG